jgi:hypothetical protein
MGDVQNDIVDNDDFRYKIPPSTSIDWEAVLSSRFLICLATIIQYETGV